MTWIIPNAQADDTKVQQDSLRRLIHVAKNQEKVDQEKRSEDDIAKGIVKFLVDVYDETGETVAIATILTMVKKLEQSL